VPHHTHCRRTQMAYFQRTVLIDIVGAVATTTNIILFSSFRPHEVTKVTGICLLDYPLDLIGLHVQNTVGYNPQLTSRYQHNVGYIIAMLRSARLSVYPSQVQCFNRYFTRSTRRRFQCGIKTKFHDSSFHVASS